MFFVIRNRTELRRRLGNTFVLHTLKTFWTVIISVTLLDWAFSACTNASEAEHAGVNRAHLVGLAELDSHTLIVYTVVGSVAAVLIDFASLPQFVVLRSDNSQNDLKTFRRGVQKCGVSLTKSKKRKLREGILGRMMMGGHRWSLLYIFLEALLERTSDLWVDNKTFLTTVAGNFSK